jgi:hypothetical protein
MKSPNTLTWTLHEAPLTAMVNMTPILTKTPPFAGGTLVDPALHLMIRIQRTLVTEETPAEERKVTMIQRRKYCAVWTTRLAESTYSGFASNSMFLVSGSSLGSLSY